MSELLFVLRSYHPARTTSTGATSNVPTATLHASSRGPQIRGERVDHGVCGGPRTRALTWGDVVHEDREPEWVPAVDGEVSRQGGDLVERAGLGADPAVRRVAMPAPGERSIDAADRQRRDEIRAHPKIRVGGAE